MNNIPYKIFYPANHANPVTVKITTKNVIITAPKQLQVIRSILFFGLRILSVFTIVLLLL